MPADEQGERSGFLPPEPGGREPDLGEAETRPLPQADPGPQSPASGGYAAPGDAHPQGHGQAQGGYGYPQGGQGQQPPPPGWGAPPAQGLQGQPQQPWVYAPQPAVPDNGQAVAGFVVSAIGGGLLLVSFGLSSIISVVCSIFGIVYSRRGRARVDRGETPKHRGLAQAGFIIGIVTLVLSSLATLGYGALLILILSDDEFRRDFEREFERELDESQTSRSSLMLAVAAVRLARAALSLVA